MTRPTDLALVTPPEPLAMHSRATSTRKAYLSDFASFEAWCARQGLASAPTTPATVAVYLAALADAGRKASTIERALAGIAWAQRARGHEWGRGHPAITTVMTGIRRRTGSAPSQKAPVVDRELAVLVATLDGSLRGLRDRALLTMGWFGAFRRSELVSLDVADVTKEHEGLIVTVRRSKRDQEGRGAEKGIPYASNPALCPVRSLAAWLEAAHIESGPIFRAVGPTRARRSGWPQRPERRADRAAGRGGRRARSEDGRGTLPTRWFRDDCSEEGKEPRRDHAADAAQERASRARLHPPRKAVRRQRGRRTRPSLDVFARSGALDGIFLSTYGVAFSVSEITMSVVTSIGTETALLAALVSGAGYGLDLIERVRAQTRGKLELRQGTVYPALREMEREGLLESYEGEPLPERGGRPRRYYRLTALGRKAGARNREVVGKLFGFLPEGA